MSAVTSVMRAQQVLLARLNEALRPFDLTFPRYEALMLLLFTRRGSLPLGKVGERLQVHRTSVTNIIDKLEADGLARRVPHAEDRRTTLAEITDEGRRVALAATEAMHAADSASARSPRPTRSSSPRCCAASASPPATSPNRRDGAPTGLTPMSEVDEVGPCRSTSPPSAPSRSSRCVSDKDLKKLAGNLREREYNDGEAVVTEGSGGIGFFFILEGKADVVIRGETRATLKQGDHFGELACSTTPTAARRPSPLPARSAPPP